MQEAQKFLKYIIPGLIFFTETSVYFLFSSDRNDFISLLNNKDLVLIIFTVLLTSGGLGYIFGVFYYGSIWFFPFKNFNEVVKLAENKHWLKMENYDDNIKLISGRKREYLIINSIMDMKVNYPESESYRRIRRLEDMVNSHGTTVVSSILAFFSGYL